MGEGDSWTLFVDIHGHWNPQGQGFNILKVRLRHASGKGHNCVVTILILRHNCMGLMVRGINIDFGIVIYSDSSGMALPAWHCVGHSKWCWGAHDSGMSLGQCL